MKAILTAIGTYGVYDPIEPKGLPQMNMASVIVELRIGVYDIIQYIPFTLDHVRANFDNTSRAKSELLTKKLIDRIYMEAARINQRDADLTDVENVIRLKMPYLLRKAINNETFIQEFDYNIEL